MRTVLGLALVGVGGYLLYRMARQQGLLPSLGLPAAEGEIVQTAYSGADPGPCQQVAAAVTIRNPTLVPKDYVVYAYAVPRGGDVTQAQARFWPNEARGVRAGMPYHGVEVNVPGLQTRTVNLWTAGWAVPGIWDVIWQLWVKGGDRPVAERRDPEVIHPTFGDLQAHCPPWF